MNAIITDDYLLIGNEFSTESSWNDRNSSNITLENSTLSPSGIANGTNFRTLGWGEAVLVSLFCSIIAGTVAGNALVIAAVITTRRLRTVTNCFVMSLAVADWLVGMFVMPPKVALFLVNNEWKLGNVTCELWISLDILLCTASILSLCAISIDRYLAITRPLAYSRRRRSKRLALSMISCVWVAAIVITSPPIFGWYDSNRNTENKCEYNENTGYVMYSALGSFFLPLLVMLYVYARIACVIAHRQKTMQKLHSSSDRFDSGRCCPNESEEPLRHVELDIEAGGCRNEQVRGRNAGSGAMASAPTTATTEFGAGSHDHQQQSTIAMSSNSANIRRIPSSNLNQSPCPARDQRDDGNNTKSFWGRLGLNSCTKGNSFRSSSGSHGKQGKNQRSGASAAGQASGAVGCSSDSESNSATIAISIPHPSTLAGNLVEGMAGGPTGPNDIIGPGGSSPGNNLHLHHRHISGAHHLSRMRTGSRLCHHSVVTTSPQRSIHRVHEASRVYTDDETVLICGTSSLNVNQRMDIPRVWTIEQPTVALSSLVAESTMKIGNSKERLENFSQSELDLRIQRKGSNYNGLSGSVGDCASASNISGGAPCSSSSIAARGMLSGPDSSARSCDNIGGRVIGVNRYYQSHNVRSGVDSHQPHGNHNIHSRRPGQSAQSSINVNSGGTAASRRSIRVNLNVHGNQDGNREFTSGRVASFKRETKTARTLAAVVGGFIICWLPFFVAYVIGPFMPSRDCIPTALMDALIWLGWGNSAINPLIYSFYSADFRSAFWRLTIHKCEGLIRSNSQRSSPRKYDDNIQLRLSRA